MLEEGRQARQGSVHRGSCSGGCGGCCGGCGSGCGRGEEADKTLPAVLGPAAADASLRTVPHGAVAAQEEKMLGKA